jgi:predicted component of type VI protein secretion system
MSYLTESKVVVSAQIEREQREALERQAAEEDRTLSAVVRRVIAEYLNDHYELKDAAAARLHVSAACSPDSEGEE